MLKTVQQLHKFELNNFFLVCVLFITFSNSTQLCTYDCIGTSGKKVSRNPRERVFVNKATAEGICLGACVLSSEKGSIKVYAAFC